MKPARRHEKLRECVYTLCYSDPEVVKSTVATYFWTEDLQKKLRDLSSLLEQIVVPTSRTQDLKDTAPHVDTKHHVPDEHIHPPETSPPKPKPPVQPESNLSPNDWVLASAVVHRAHTMMGIKTFSLGSARAAFQLYDESLRGVVGSKEFFDVVRRHPEFVEGSIFTCDEEARAVMRRFSGNGGFYWVEFIEAIRAGDVRYKKTKSHGRPLYRRARPFSAAHRLNHTLDDGDIDKPRPVSSSFRSASFRKTVTRWYALPSEDKNILMKILRRTRNTLQYSGVRRDVERLFDELGRYITPYELRDMLLDPKCVLGRLRLAKNDKELGLMVKFLRTRDGIDCFRLSSLLIGDEAVQLLAM